MPSVIHIALTPLAGSPIRLVSALNAHTDWRARLIVASPNAYGRRTFEQDLAWDWDRDRDEAFALLAEADVVHFHHFFPIDRGNPFGIDFRKIAPRARFIRQFHTHPLTIAQGNVKVAQAIINDDLPQLVVAQFQERYYPRALPVPNIIPLPDADLHPREPKIAFSPSIMDSAWHLKAGQTRWDTKGAPEVLKVMQRVARAHGLKIDLIHDIPHSECLRRKTSALIGVDDLVTGSYHLSGLEMLAIGMPVFNYLDGRTITMLTHLTNAPWLPWINVRLGEIEPVALQLLKDRDMLEHISAASRQWMKDYWAPAKLVSHYTHAYQFLLEGRHWEARLTAPQTWLGTIPYDAIWNRERVFARNSLRRFVRRFTQSKVIVRLIHPRQAARIAVLETELAQSRTLAEELARDATLAWLYRNRVERMDATIPRLFDPLRREFHLARYRFAAGRTHGGRIADIACGTGYGTALLADTSNGSEVWGIDVDKESIAYATRHHARNGARFCCAEGCATGLETSAFDTVVSFETIEHFEHPDQLLAEFRRLLKPDGQLVISVPNDWAITDAPFHKHQISAAAFEALLSRHFQTREFWAQNSGSPTQYNHGQPAGLVPATPENRFTAECLIAVCHP